MTDRILTQKIRTKMEALNIQYTEVDHAESTTCEESAKNRGESVSIGGKSILFKDKKDFRIFVISANLEIDSNKVRKILNSQRLRFATQEELWDLCAVEKGCLPPFGRDILPFDLYVDESIFENERIAFNAGILTKSFILDIEDYRKLIKPTKITNFSKC